MASIIPRPAYLAAIEPYIDQPLVKVLTGLRRSGKSSLLMLVQQELAARGVPAGHIISLDFDSLGLSNLTTAAALNEYLTSQMSEKGRYYLLLDEIQEVDGWEKVINSLIATTDVDIYLTGSNSRLLSSELATYIAGRYIAIEVSTLSFSEHLEFARRAHETIRPSLADEFSTYSRRGGFPGLHGGSYTDQQLYRAVRDIYASALIQDTISRHGIRNVDMLQRVAAFALENVGNPFSARSVSDYFKSQRRRIDPETVLSYMSALTESFILTKVPRFDLQGRKLLTINEKYYAGDISLIHATLGYSDRHFSGVLENIVLAELRRRGFSAWVGKLGNQEVDFVAERDGERLYVQVTVTMSDERTRNRELAPLAAIRDSFPKLVLSLDQHAGGLEAGIHHLWLPAWLIQEQT